MKTTRLSVATPVGLIVFGSAAFVQAPFTDITMQAVPGFQMFYDWQGMLLFQPNVRFIRDPWRFIVDYTTINSGVFRSQIGLVRDRSNVRMQIEYVL